MLTKLFNLKIFLLCLFAIALYSTFTQEAIALDFELDMDVGSVGTIEKKGDEHLSSFAANITILFLIIANVAILARFIFGFINTDETKGRKRLPPIHYIFNLLAFGTLLLHAHWASATSPFFIGSEIVMVAIGLAGVFLLLIDRSEKESIIIAMKTKRALSVALILLLVIGHILVDE